MDSFNSRELCKKVVKYILQGAIISIAVLLLQKNKPDFEAVIALGLIASSTYAIIDLFAPSLTMPVNLGVGFGIGAQLVGFPGH